jgi:hypothetical protein
MNRFVSAIGAGSADHPATIETFSTGTANTVAAMRGTRSGDACAL